MKSKIFGGVLLIVGTSVGSGMLALPVATAQGGFFHSSLLLFFAWAFSTIGAFLALEANLCLPEGANFISMAKSTLGKTGQVVTWICYLMLFYSLLSAYIAGGGDLLHSLLQAVHFESASWTDALLFTVVLGAVVLTGVRSVDLTNRVLMLAKLGAYILVVMLVTPHVDLAKLEGGQPRKLLAALMVVMTSFGYASVLPSLRSYYKGHVATLRKVVAVGSLLSLVIYILWDLAVQGTIEKTGATGLAHMAISGHAVSDLTTALSTVLHSSTVSRLTHFFTAVCMTTSFLAVALSLSHFLKDGLARKNCDIKLPWLALATFAPPLAIVIFFPGMFLIGLGYAGIFCVILLMLLPALMVYVGRYRKQLKRDYRFCGGKWLVIMEVLVSCVFIIYGIVYL